MKNFSDKNIKTWKPLDAFIILAVLAAAAICFFVIAGGAADGALEAVVRQNGAVVKTIDLSALDSPVSYTVKGDGAISVTILAESDGVRVSQAGCKDQICVKTGKLTYNGQTAVCLPAKVTVELISGSQTGHDGIDAVTG